MITLAAQLEAFLFWSGEPHTILELSEVFEVEESVIEEAVNELAEQLKNRGIVLVRSGRGLILATHPEAGSLIQKVRTEELSKELSKAALEVLAIIFYKNGASRSEIEYIRGANSQVTLRTLLIRGLIEKTDHPTDNRQAYYIPTADTLLSLGISDPTGLTGYSEMQAELLKNLHKQKDTDSTRQDTVEEPSMLE